ncbi:DUF6002 family protein [Couchioplanes caeruleus]|uniref:Uncharacterized protein n=1 Tax=Couchioplanes caeruleus TaxID=56438 RepID=A0A3N1GM61_9ACTN|nr:DUF6002 family protein [Couchioplanes caeruleus]ROP31352.1 hypothetical protein EDD30_4251 [Couchioplanes caeruleus]
MAEALQELKAPIVVENVLARYIAHVRAALQALQDRTRDQQNLPFVPMAGLPDDGTLDKFFSLSGVAVHDLGEFGGKHLTLMDLMRNPRTRTTKTYPSLVLVARAIQHIHQTGERVMIVTPSSANKATALRDAVLWAIECGLVSAVQLQILSVVPWSSREKLWSSALSDDPALARRNPVTTYDGPETGHVKVLAHELVKNHAAKIWSDHGVRLWYTMDIENYMVADVVRAHVEHEFLRATPGQARLHAHAVSSAFGLLGHNRGLQQLAATGDVDPAASRYFLVQHLGTPDMVLSLYSGDTSRAGLPEYVYDESQGVYRQDRDPHFPFTTFATDEVLDPTFYTRRPVTSGVMNDIIRQRGGGGIVVSLQECLGRYGQVSALLDRAGVRVPADPRQLREWSLMIGMTGVLNAVDRGLVSEDEIVVHGSGSYSSADYKPITEDRLLAANDVDRLARVAEEAARGSSW